MLYHLTIQYRPSRFASTFNCKQDITLIPQDITPRIDARAHTYILRRLNNYNQKFEIRLILRQTSPEHLIRSLNDNNNL